MGHKEILNFLKAHDSEWFSYKELKEYCKETNRQPLARLIKWGWVKTKYKPVSRTIKYCDRKAAKTCKHIAYYKYNNEIEE